MAEQKLRGTKIKELGGSYLSIQVAMHQAKYLVDPLGPIGPVQNPHVALIMRLDVWLDSVQISGVRWF